MALLEKITGPLGQIHVSENTEHPQESIADGLLSGHLRGLQVMLPKGTLAKQAKVL